MLLDNRRKLIDRKVSPNTMAFARNLLLVLVIFNLGVFGYTKRVIKSTSDPVVTSKLIDEMVIYHFAGSLVLGAGLCFITFASEKED